MIPGMSRSHLDAATPEGGAGGGLAARFVDLVLGDEVNRTIVQRGHLLGVADWWLTAGALFQVIWNSQTARPLQEGIRDHHIFCFDPTDTSYEAEDAVVHFASTTCCYALTRHADGTLETYAPHGYDHVFAGSIRPNPVLAPREVYETKAARWTQQRPHLVVQPWPSPAR